MNQSRKKSNLDSDSPPDKNGRVYGWFAHIGCCCVRCGNHLGPHLVHDDSDQEMWGCGHCGVGVLCGDEDQPSLNAAADIFMSMMRVA